MSLTRFGPRPGRAAISPSWPGSFLFNEFEQGEMSGLDDFRDLAGQVFADTGKLRQVASG